MTSFFRKWFKPKPKIKKQNIIDEIMDKNPHKLVNAMIAYLERPEHLKDGRIQINMDGKLITLKIRFDKSWTII